MERDARRDRGQWRGCHSFKDIICDGDKGLGAKRNGGLKMGQTYYYYYELDGATETHDPTVASTTACPFLPGQKVNTLWVPVERSCRMRSASTNSLQHSDIKTMKPSDKFVTPRPPPPVPSVSARLGTAPNPIRHVRSARSLSPTPSWPWSPRRLFGRRSPSSRDGDRDLHLDDASDDGRSTRGSEGSRSRNISPESLRRFLVDDDLVVAEPAELVIPEDIAEEVEDDDNFATSAASESMLYSGLSPPPLQRGLSSTTILASATEAPTPQAPTRPAPTLPTLHLDAVTADPAPLSRFSLSSDDDNDESIISLPASPPLSPDSPALPSFYHSESEDDAGRDEDPDVFPAFPSADSFAASLRSAFAGYSLPAVEDAKAPAACSVQAAGSPALLARNGSDLPVGNTSLLAAPEAGGSGLEDLVNELGWIADVIRNKSLA